MNTRGKLVTYALIAVGSQWVSEPLFQSLPAWAQALSRCAIVALITVKAYTSDPNLADGAKPAPIPPVQKPAGTTDNQP